MFDHGLIHSAARPARSAACGIVLALALILAVAMRADDEAQPTNSSPITQATTNLATSPKAISNAPRHAASAPRGKKKARILAGSSLIAVCILALATGLALAAAFKRR